MDNVLENVRMILEILNRKLYEYTGIGVIIPRVKRVRVRVKPVEPEVVIRNR